VRLRAQVDPADRPVAQEVLVFAQQAAAAFDATGAP